MAGTARVATGLDILARDASVVAGRRVGLIANPTSVDASLRHAADLLHADASVTLAALFGPEHGIRGDAQYMVAVGDEVDARTGVPVHSLYGAHADSLRPSAAALADLDALVFDIQDVGARYYTYVWTMVLAMRACAGTGVRFVVLDRPNPIGGELVEGGAIDDGYTSFVGLCSVPNRHGLTAGELARWIRARERLDVDLHVVAMEGWSRHMSFEDTGLPWVMPSPNMPTVDTALVYPGMCLLEGTTVSEGRGTTRPFELVGAPYVDPHELAAALGAAGLPGVRYRPVSFIPTWEKHAGTACHGVQLHVTDRRAFRPYRTAVALLEVMHRLYPDSFSWREHAYEFVEDIPAIDLLAGSPALRTGVESGASLEELIASFTADEAELAAARTDFLLYR